MTAGRIESVEIREAVEEGEAVNLVVLRTDTGECGTGELAGAPGWPPLEPAIPALTRLLAGCDPFDQAEIVARATASREPMLADPVMLAAVTTALADLVGRDLGVPLCRLLGGQVRDYIPVCAVDWAGHASSPGEFAQAARQIAAAGFTTIRLDLDIDPARPWAAAEIAGAVREAVPDVRLVTRTGAAWPAVQILHLLRAAPGLDILWLEASAATTAELRRLAERAPVALAAGRGLRPEAVDALAGAGLVDHLVLDPGTAGGLRRARELAALAEIHHTDVVAAGSGSSRSLAVAMQLAAAIPNLAVVEARSRQVAIRDGVVPVDLEPGLNDHARSISPRMQEVSS
jgi:L-alanine-DL-glutamate epimerase-like enolase superfamily enzyme